MILAASSMFKSRSRAASLAPISFEGAAEVLPLEWGKGLAKLVIASTTAGCHGALWNYENI
jgi:hypothetical protein